MRATQPIPTCPQCGANVYRTHHCRASALRPGPKPEPRRDPSPAPRFGPCLHATPCLEVRTGSSCALIVPKPADFDAQVARARAQVWADALLEDVGL